MTQPSLLTALLSHPLDAGREPLKPDDLMVALSADPALAGRVRWNDAGVIELSGPNGSAPPASLKERTRWELHVRLRLEAEFGKTSAVSPRIEWVDSLANDNRAP